jgi:hypothetical protein
MKTTSPRAQALKTIEAAYNALPYMSDGFKDVKRVLFEANLTSEKQHRKFTSPRTTGFSTTAAAKLFTIKHLAESLESPDRYTVDDILCIRLECLKAQAYAKRHRAEILVAWTVAGIDPEDIRAIDYAELMEA